MPTTGSCTLTPLYKWAHALHHRNVNTGPWSGISMHPLEHVLYLSLPFVFLVIPGSPFIATFCIVYLLLSPSPSGFDRFRVSNTTLHAPTNPSTPDVTRKAVTTR